MRALVLVVLAVSLDAHAARPQLEAMAERAAALHRVPPELLKAVCHVESAWQPSAEGKVGEIGLCQIKIETALDLYGAHWRRNEPEHARRAAMRAILLVPERNLRLAALLLRRYLDRFEGDETLALIAYNGGPGHRLIVYALKVRKARERYVAQ